jgi:1-acyl-sn-glycerol-3-phosphate acyltransferase
MRPSSYFLVGVARLLVGAYPRWIGCGPDGAQRIYFANHTSHIDTIALWAALPPRLRDTTRPVAARDYWGAGARRYIATKTLNAVLIDRKREERDADPLEPLADALAGGASLILFPEGTRGAAAVPGPFKGGLFHLASRFPRVELIPVHLENLQRSLPKGALVPVPLSCTVRFGAPLHVEADEPKHEFLSRARRAVVELSGLSE